jgi:transcriptional regulator with XRE-family HTH domain
LSELGEYVKQHTVDTGLSIKEVARRASVAFETVRQLLRGSRLPSDETLQAMAAAFPALSLAKLRDLAGQPPERVRREVPRELDLLTDEEWSVVVRVGRQILRSSGRMDQIPTADGVQPVDVTRIQALTHPNE